MSIKMSHLVSSEEEKYLPTFFYLSVSQRMLLVIFVSHEKSLEVSDFFEFCASPSNSFFFPWINWKWRVGTVMIILKEESILGGKISEETPMTVISKLRQPV